MTRYTVVWDEDVEDPFINAWVAGDSQMRSTLTEIANWVDANLAADPDRKGQPSSDKSARVIVVPLANSSARVSVAYLP
jgi:hypothetical protein